MQSLTLPPRDRKAPGSGVVPGPQVRAQTARLSPASGEPEPAVLIGTNGLQAASKDGRLKHDNLLANSWSAVCRSNLCVEFELPRSVALAALEVWNFNGALTTTNGVRRLDVAVSSDGQSWRTVLRGAELAEAPGTSDYDEPAVLKLDGSAAKWVRLENLAPLADGGRVGLGKVIFHQSEASGLPDANKAGAK